MTRLQGQQKDERKGAERVNELLSHFFGHDGIELEAKTMLRILRLSLKSPEMANQPTT